MLDISHLIRTARKYNCAKNIFPSAESRNRTKLRSFAKKKFTNWIERRVDVQENSKNAERRISIIRDGISIFRPEICI